MKIINALIVVLMLQGCASLSRSVKKTEPNLKPQATVMIMSQMTVDPYNVKAQLEGLLMERGFEVVDPAVSSDYILRYSYSIEDSFPVNKVFQSFTAILVDTDDGNIVRSVRFNSGSIFQWSMKKTLKKAVAQL